ncbi:MAG: Unknown protein [uncultured Sulfurovum sp.]|uniref:DUF502 domain-containing protein n=1 Tax=uncultured Sulfurovum sp. TaxID=269237 RepID=A0A6S6TZR3_9BACT|nr:MAG: Unknown protein [uncultured Sulfurovum sp.]
MQNNEQTFTEKFKNRTIQGLFWILPIAAILMIIFWLYDKIDLIVSKLLDFIGINPQNHEFLWIIGVLALFIFILYIIGYLIKTQIAFYVESLFHDIPGFSTIKDIISIFNSSKEGDNKVLVVAIRGFANEGYNIGLMYSQKESIIKDHYTVTLSMTPIPNGGYMFEVHKDNIFIIENAKFDDNLQYLLSMGVKSIAEVLKVQPKSLDEMQSLNEWLELNSKAY